jgi:signal transduction histidine kinase
MFGMEVLTHLHQLERINRSLYQAVLNIRPFEQRMVSVATERGTTELSLKAASFKTRDEELVILSVQDIRNELDEKELDSWMKLIRVLMHEIMNSIAPITSLSQSLSNLFTIDGHELLPQEINEKTIRTTVRGLNVIGEQGNGLILFVESYRKLTRLPKPEKKLFKAEDLINRIKVLYSSLENSSRVKLTVVINPPEMELFADENLISQVMLNLLKNALEALRVKASEGSIRITVDLTANSRPEICVSDNGPGIPPEIMEQIFVPFFTTRDSGSGIGLSLSRQIMRLHGGSLQVRSVQDKETTFYMIF